MDALIPAGRGAGAGALYTDTIRHLSWLQGQVIHTGLLKPSFGVAAGGGAALFIAAMSGRPIGVYEVPAGDGAAAGLLLSLCTEYLAPLESLTRFMIWAGCISPYGTSNRSEYPQVYSSYVGAHIIPGVYDDMSPSEETGNGIGVCI